MDISATLSNETLSAGGMLDADVGLMGVPGIRRSSHAMTDSGTISELCSVAPLKRKGPQLALEPLDGRGIAGYVPEPELWARSDWLAPRENPYML
jgi:hypothetical protein